MPGVWDVAGFGLRVRVGGIYTGVRVCVAVTVKVALAVDVFVAVWVNVEVEVRVMVEVTVDVGANSVIVSKMEATAVSMISDSSGNLVAGGPSSDSAARVPTGSNEALLSEPACGWIVGAERFSMKELNGFRKSAGTFSPITF